LNDEQRLDWLRLIRSENVGPRTFHDLVKYYGGVGAALSALPGLARRGGSARGSRIFSREQAEAELQAAHAAGVEYVTLDEPEYPSRLQAIDDPPPVIAIRGQCDVLVPPGPYSIDLLAQDVIELLDALGIQNTSFCGLSMGGMVGMALALNFPDRFHKMVLCNTSPKIGSSDSWNARINAVNKGGMKAVVWTELLQAGVYLSGGAAALLILGHLTPGGWSAIWSGAHAAGKTRVLDFTFTLSNPQTVWAGLIGGAFLAMASHGTDQLIVQRLMSSRTLKDAQRAIIGSGFVVFCQFFLFLCIGLGLWAFYHGRSFPITDQIFPTFILEHMPSGLVGLIGCWTGLTADRSTEFYLWIAFGGALGGLFAEDAVYQGPDGKTRHGSKEIGEFYVKMLAKLRPQMKTASFIEQGSECVMELENKDSKGRYVLTAVDHFTVDQNGKATHFVVYFRPGAPLPNLKDIGK
jgi:pimeloyl-ACP methyl ester carboxylesterase